MVTEGAGKARLEKCNSVIAIGGVRPEHIPALRAAGAHGVAAIRGVWHARDAGAAVIEYLSAHGALESP